MGAVAQQPVTRTQDQAYQFPPYPLMAMRRALHNCPMFAQPGSSNDGIAHKTADARPTLRFPNDIFIVQGSTN